MVKKETSWTVGKVLLVVFLIPVVLLGGCVLVISALVGIGQYSELQEAKQQIITLSPAQPEVKVPQTSYKLESLDIITPFQDYSMEVAGKIRNTGDTFLQAYQVKVFIECSDKDKDASDKKMVGTGWTYVDHPISPGEISTFKTYIDVSIPSVNVKSCSAFANPS